MKRLIFIMAALVAFPAQAQINYQAKLHDVLTLRDCDTFTTPAPLSGLKKPDHNYRWLEGNPKKVTFKVNTVEVRQVGTNIYAPVGAPACPVVAPPPPPAPPPVAQPPVTPPAATVPVAVGSGDVRFGVNLSGADFSGSELLPTVAELTKWGDAGARVVRVPIKHSRFQPVDGGPIEPKHMAWAQAYVAAAKAYDMFVIFEDHSYDAKRDPALVADFTTKVLEPFKNDPMVGFGLMNEPNGSTFLQYVTNAQASIYAIRAAGFNNKLFVCFPAWCSPYSIDKGFIALTSKKDPDSLRSAIDHLPGGTIIDPANNFVIEVHSYLDKGGSGQNVVCKNTPEGKLGHALDYAKPRGYKIFVGEWATGSDKYINGNCKGYAERAVALMKANPDVFWGSTVWSSGGRWNGKYLWRVEDTASAYAQTILGK